MLLDMVARRYGTRPSALVGLHPDLPITFNFDLLVAAHGVRREIEASRASEDNTMPIENVRGLLRG